MNAKVHFRAEVAVGIGEVELRQVYPKRLKGLKAVWARGGVKRKKAHVK